MCVFFVVGFGFSKDIKMEVYLLITDFKLVFFNFCFLGDNVALHSEILDIQPKKQADISS